MKYKVCFLLIISILSLSCGVQASVLPVVTGTAVISTSTVSPTMPEFDKKHGQISTETARPSIFTVGSVWVRSEPNGRKLYALPAGSEVRVSECLPDGWCRVEDGWLWAGCLGLQGRECRGE